MFLFFQDNKIYETSEEIKYIQRMVLLYEANCAMAPTKLIKKSFITQYNIYHDDNLKQGAEGIEFNVRKCRFVNRNFYHYVYNNDSITTKPNEENYYMVLNCFKKIKQEIDMADSNVAKTFYSRVYVAIVTTMISGFLVQS